MFINRLSRASLTSVFNLGARAKFIVLALLVIIGTQLQSQPAEINVGPNCTLAQAINAANGTGSTGSCAAGRDGAGAAGADVINMPATADTLNLSAALPTIASTITINGNGWTISGDSDNDGDGDTRLFLVIYGKLTINNMTLTKASIVPADLNGGAIHTTSESVSTTISNSTFYSNRARFGGAVYIAGGTVKLLHATIVNNRARSTNPANQGGGVNIAATGTEIKNSLLSGNTGGDCRQSATVSGINSNLIRTGNCGTPYSADDPLLPANPTVPTDLTDPPAYFPLPSNSPAVNAVTCLDGVNLDQLGETRPYPANGNCDIGAVEYQLAPAVRTQNANATSTQRARQTATQNEIDRRNANATATQNARETARPDIRPDDPPNNDDPPDDGEPPDRPPSRTGTPTDTPIPTNTATATATYIAATPTPTAMPIRSRTYEVSKRIYLQSIYGDIKTEALEMLDLDKHPALQGGRLAARIWRSNPQCAHRVAADENLFRLSLRYNTTVEALRRHNYLKSELIRAGQELSLPVCPQQMMELGRAWICFKADGALVFIDTTSSPPAVHALQTFTGSGFTCAVIYRPGTVVLTELR